MKRVSGAVAAAGFIGCIAAANWAIEEWGPVPVGFGLEAPAGVYFVALALTCRDFVQEHLGRLWTVGAIVAGAVLSYFLASSATIPGGLMALSIASGIAFLVSELADFAVFTPLRESGKDRAIVVSNLVGAAVDSWLFLWLAFGGLTFFWGQVVGKLIGTAIFIAVRAVLRRRESDSVLPRYA